MVHRRHDGSVSSPCDEIERVGTFWFSALCIPVVSGMRKTASQKRLAEVSYLISLP